MHQKLHETIYTPESEFRRPLKLLANMFRDIISSKELAWRLFVRNISARYRQTIGGYLWAILPPILTSLLWVFLNSQKIIIVKTTSVPYPMYVLVGTILWQIFADSIYAPARVVKDSAAMIAKINFPREALIIAAFLEIIFNLLIQISLFALVIIYFNIKLKWAMMWGGAGVFGIIMMGMMIGILITPISILYGDIQQGLPMILQLLFYLTPIVYSPPKVGVAAIISTYNPISPLLQLTRELITTGNVICLGPSIVVFSATAILLLMAWILYRISIPHLIERIAA